MAMTNAERQRRYRDKKRGGPPQRQCAGSLTEAAKAAGLKRTTLWMLLWINKHAPDVDLDRISASTPKTAPASDPLSSACDAST
jgi:hypothetical protein